jgi:S-adenosylmethionine-diacylglycerol 3-amino-3-carboxypropyl transferase
VAHLLLVGTRRYSVEARALAIGGHTNLLSLTASGSRVLELLLERPRRILAIDWNPAQNALAELKIAGIRHLQREPYLRFMGVLEAGDRLETYARLRASLSDTARDYWDARPKVVASGIQYSAPSPQRARSQLVLFASVPATE